ncbi:MAG: cytidine deaminase [Actinomycetota bacterium]
MSDTVDLDALVTAARDIRSRAYAPYSGFHVGAALLAGGKLFAAVNVENASYPLSVCAERNAAAMAVACGETVFQAIAVVTDAETPTPPCGGCLQVLSEFGPAIPVVAESADGSARIVWRVEELLPVAFGPHDLGI